MDQVDLDAVVKLGQQTCVLIIAPPFMTLSSVTLDRLTDKVILRFRMRAEEEQKLTVYPAIQRYMTALHFMWLYDYFLTFGDEVSRRDPSISRLWSYRS